VGDHALREVASVLQRGVRAYDLCVRYAGDEFILVLGDCSREAAEAKCLELQARIEDLRIEGRFGRRLSLAASAGVSVFPEDGTTYEQLLAHADQRMVRDKAARRDRARPAALEAGFKPAAIFGSRVPQGTISVWPAGRISSKDDSATFSVRSSSTRAR
jgi:diguanylate cyclase (GGDEF)-like protein